MTPRLVVIGGGISGLAAAWAARQQAASRGRELGVLVLERASEIGGKATTLIRDGWLVEGGPSGFHDGNEILQRLVASVGMSPEVLRAAPESNNRFIYRDGRMRAVKPNPIAFARSGLLSARGVARAAAEPFVPRRRDPADETVWDFAARRLGREVADRLISPMTIGIFAGDARQLSLASAFPRMAALERDHGSLIRGMIARRGRTSQGVLSSFRDGMQSFPRAVARLGGFHVRCDSEVRALWRDGDRWHLATGGEVIQADAVVIAAEPCASANLLNDIDGVAAEQLRAIPAPAVTVVTLGIGPEDAPLIPAGFGTLISRGAGFRMLGNFWESRLYPGRAPDGHVLIRAMVGGAVDQEGGALDEDHALALVHDEVSRLYGLRGPAVFSHVRRIPRAIPQYVIGHANRVVDLDRRFRGLKLPRRFSGHLTSLDTSSRWEVVHGETDEGPTAFQSGV